MLREVGDGEVVGDGGGREGFGRLGRELMTERRVGRMDGERWASSPHVVCKVLLRALKHAAGQESQAL